MQLKPAQLEAQLRRGLAPVYLLAGDEPLILQECADAVRAAARASGFEERQALVVEAGFDWSQLKSAGQNLSLFAQKRRIELYLDRSPGVEGGAALRDYAGSLPQDVVLLVLAGGLDKDTRKSAWAAALDKAGVMVYSWPVKDAEFERWLAARAQRVGLQAQPEALAELGARTEGNLLACAQELDKLKLLYPDGQLDLERVRASVADSARFDSFDLVDKVLAGRAAEALRRLERLREEGEEPPAVLGSLHWALQALARVTAAQQGGGNVDTAFAQSRVFGPEKRAVFSQAAKRLGAGRINRLLVDAARVDRVTKGAESGLVWPELVKLCAGQSGMNLPAGISQRSALRI
ncbi:MAG: DNA polymerase III subunit delta [Nevskiales bacterium]